MRFGRCERPYSGTRGPDAGPDIIPVHVLNTNTLYFTINNALFVLARYVTLPILKTTKYT